MKNFPELKLFLIIVLALAMVLMVGALQAGERVVKISGDDITVKPICVAGYVFVLVVADAYGGTNLSLTQVMGAATGSYPPQPIRCAE